MKTSNLVTLVVVALVVGGILMVVSPGFRAMVMGKYNNVIDWSEEAIRKDPIGYMRFVEKKLTQDQNAIQATWRNLGVSVGKLAKKQSKSRETLEKGLAYANEFREAYQNAKGEFPVEVLGESYTEAQLRAQLSLTLAQNGGLEQSLTEIDEALIDASSKLEELIVQKEKTETQLTLIATKREMFQAKTLSTEGLHLVAQLNGLFEENDLVMVMAGNPVRTIEQLDRKLAQVQKMASVPASSAKVEDFLNANKKEKPSDTKIEKMEKLEVVEEDLDDAITPVVFKKKTNKKSKVNKKGSQPIYQQSI